MGKLHRAVGAHLAYLGLYNKLVKLEGHDQSDRGGDNDRRLAPEDEANSGRSI